MPLDPAVPGATSPEGRLMERLAALEKKVRNMEQYHSGGTTQQFPLVTVLPTAGRKGRAVVLSSNSKLYIDNGVAWIAQT
jgi:hypothetical protein